MLKSEVIQVVTMLTHAFPSVHVKHENMQVYSMMLEDLPYEETLKAVKRVLSESEFSPSISAIRKAVADVQHGAVRSGADAWLDVLKQIRDEGYCGTPWFSDPVVAKIVEQWGWRALCCEGDDVADRARFCEAYNSLAKAHRADIASGVPLERRMGPGSTPERIGAGKKR